MAKHDIFTILLFVLTLFSPYTKADANAANDVPLTGVVVFKDGKPVSYATVVIRSMNRHALTDEKGKFEFPELPFGQYLLEVSSVEIKPETFSVNYTGNYRTTTFEVAPALRSLDEVVVRGNSHKRTLETRGFAVSVLEPQAIALQSIQTNELLDRTVGVRIRQEGGLGSRTNYNINGLSGEAVKVFIDGVPSSNFGVAFSLNSIPPALIERIEIYKGVVPGYLSEDALGGAINIILKKKATNSLIASYSTGSFNTHQANATGFFRSEKGLTVEASAFYNYSDNDYKVWGKNITFKDYKGGVKDNRTARRFHDAYQSHGVRISAGFTKLKWADRMMVGGIFSKNYKEMQHGITMDAVYGDRHTRRNSNVLTFNYEKTDFLLSGLSLKMDATHSRLTRQVIDTVGVMYDWSGEPIRYPDGTPLRYTGGAEVGSARTTAQNNEKSYLVRTNVGYGIARGNKLYINHFFNNFTRSTFDAYLEPELQRLSNTRDMRKNILAATFENIAFRQRLRTTLFYKYYAQRLISHEPRRTNPSAPNPVYEILEMERRTDFGGYGFTASFALRQNLHLMASAEKAIRLPNANEVFGNVTDNLLAPTAELKPETSFNANAGVIAGPYFAGEHSLKVSATLFYRDTRGMIREAIRAGSYDYSQFENLENVLSRGIDAELVYNYAERFNFSFNVSKFDVLFNTEFDQLGARYDYYRTQIRNEPSFKFNGNASYYLENVGWKKTKLGVHANINYVKAFHRNWANVGGNNLDIIPTQYPVDAGLTYAFPGQKIVLGFDAKNIFNQQVFDNFGLQKPGRAFFGKITYVIL